MDSRAIVFFGRSGCGKGTQAKLLSEFLKSRGRQTMYVETGSAFRELSQGSGFTGELIGEILHDGKLIPVFLPIWVWTEIFVKKFSGKEDVVLDGVCRRLEESIALDSAFGFYKFKKPDIILMNVSKDWSYTRMMERKRSDDTPEKIQNRLDWYEKDVEPAINYFRNKPEFNFLEINGEQSIGDVHEDIIKALNL